MWLGSRVTTSLATACQELCSSYFLPLGWLQLAPLVAVGVVIALGLTSLGLASTIAIKQLALGRRLDRETKKGSCQWPTKLQDAVTQLDLTETIVCLEDPAAYAFCHGYLHPAIYVSCGLVSALTVDELKAVLAHEAEHARRRDPLRLLLSLAAARALFFLPIGSEIQQRVALTAELTADARAVNQAGLVCLARALRKMLLGDCRQIDRLPAVGGLNSLSERVRYLSTGKSHSLPGISPSSVIISALIGLAIFTAGLGAGVAPTLAASNQPSCCLAAEELGTEAGCSAKPGPTTQRDQPLHRVMAPTTLATARHGAGTSPNLNPQMLWGARLDIGAQTRLFGSR